MEIPEDIMETAHDAFVDVSLIADDDECVRIIARALLAERKRATQAERDRVNAMWDRGNAAAIRTPSTGEEAK